MTKTGELIDVDGPNRGDEPPSYDDARAGTAAAPPRPVIPGLPQIDIAAYNVAQSALSSDQETRTTTLPLLNTSPQALVSFLQKQSRLPPKPVIRIRGIHRRHNDSISPDFDLFLNITPYIVRDAQDSWNSVKVQTPSVTTNDVKTPNDRMFGIEEWAQRFCQDPSPYKTFSLQREVVNWDTAYLESQIRVLIENLNYVGEVTITFPLHHSKVVVSSSYPTTQPASNGGLFSFKLSAKAPLPSKEYDIVKTIWPYATSTPGDFGPGHRQCAVETEQIWWHTWKAAIRNAVLKKRFGWITVEDQIEVAMGTEAPIPEKAWGVVASL